MSGANGSRRRVAITGLGPVTPVGIGAEECWRALLEGRSGVAPVEAFPVDRHRVRIGAEVRDFDPGEWLSLRDVKRNDRLCHMALVAAELAVADAELNGVPAERIATVFASGGGGFWSLACQAVELERRGPGVVSPFTIPVMMPNKAVGTIATHFRFRGPSACPVSACSSSSDAIGWGLRLLRDGYADACLVGGAEAALNPLGLAAFGNLRALSTRNDDPAGASRPFDADRDGFVLGEGAAALMLEPLDRAVARGAKVYAEVAGYGQATDAYHDTAPAPDGEGAARAIGEALADAGVEPSDVDYVNAHGTSTPLSDAAETRAIRRALGPASDRVAVSSTKSMTGHLLGAAGAVEAVACALAIRDGWIPPTINYATPDPDCDLDYVPNEPRRADVRVALSNAMGFGGHDVVLVLRRP